MLVVKFRPIGLKNEAEGEACCPPTNKSNQEPTVLI